jgi:hypothetical protein
VVGVWARRKRNPRPAPTSQPLRHRSTVGELATFERADGSIVSRTVRCMDAFDFLAESASLDGYVITSLPDMVEIGLEHDLDAYRRFLDRAVGEVFERLRERGIAIFYQSNVKTGGLWLDKAHAIHASVDALGGRLLWHKIALFRAPETLMPSIRARGPPYSHLLAFSKGVRIDEPWFEAAATPDVLARGRMPWARAMGVDACEAACELVIAAVAHEARRPGAPLAIVIDPFCGKGTALAVANGHGLDALGVEIQRKRSEAARTLTIPEEDRARLPRAARRAAHAASIGRRSRAAVEREPEPRDDDQ